MPRVLRRVLKWSAIAVALLLLLAAGALAVAYVRSDNDCAERARATVRQPMKAVVYCDYGPPEMLSVQTLEKPVPAADQILVRVHAAAVNPLDLHFMRGKPYIMRPGTGMRKPKNTRLGVDFSGTVEAVGSSVTAFQAGDEVFGARNGAFAEYITSTGVNVVKKPANLSFEEAAAVPVAALTALQALRDKAKAGPGKSVLINGASGGVGTFAVQIAKSLGATVTGVCSARNVALVRSLGADAVVDYTKEDFTAGSKRYDIVIDMVGNHSLRAVRRVLRPNGIYVMVGGQNGNWIAPLDRILAMSVTSAFSDETFVFLMSKLNRADLQTLSDLLAAGTIKPVIDRRYPLSEAAEAVRYLETGRARGKVILQVTAPAS